MLVAGGCNTSFSPTPPADGFSPVPGSTTPTSDCASYGTFAKSPAFRATVEVPATRIASGTTFQASVTITNTSPSAANLETSSSLEVYLFRPGEAMPIGWFDRASVGTGLSTLLEPGKSITVPAQGGTASCDLSVGHTLQPGQYQARSLVDFAAGPDGGNGPFVFWSNPLKVEIVPAGT